MAGVSTSRASREGWKISVQPSDAAGQDDDDARFWLQIPVAERAAATWELSVELFSLAARNAGVFDEQLGTWLALGDLGERRLSRASFLVTRR